LFDRGDFPYPLPGRTGPLRVALVGAPPEVVADVPGVQLSLADEPDPDAHVVVVFDPQEPPADVRGVTVGWFTHVLRQPRARSRPDNSDIAPPAPPAGAFDRLIAADPALGDHVEVWRSVPLPVGDHLYGDVVPAREKPLVAWAAPPREEAKLAEADIAPPGTADPVVVVNVHPDHWPRFEHEVARHLAAGRLMISEQLAPLHGLEPDLDFLQADDPDRILDFLWTLERFPAEFDRVRHRGRLKAEHFRASRIWPRVLHDLLLDVREFGTDRATA